MGPPSAAALSPVELSYLHTSLSILPPIRPDARLPTQFRPLIAETDLLPATNGSARICFADGTEAIVGVKAEVAKTPGVVPHLIDNKPRATGLRSTETCVGKGRSEWIGVSIEIPGLKDDDSMPVFMSSVLREALIADTYLPDQLYINRRYHWNLHVDILLLSPPLSYPLPLLSLTTHLALLSTRLPSLKSEGEEDPMFDDDWDASRYLYLRTPSAATTDALPSYRMLPPVTLLVMTVGQNIIFDPTREELSVAEAVMAVSIAAFGREEELRLLGVRTLDPPSRLTTPGVPDWANTATGGVVGGENAQHGRGDSDGREGVWTPPTGGVKRNMIGKVIEAILGKGGVGREVMEGLSAVDVG